MAGPYQPHQGTDPYSSQPLPYPDSYGAPPNPGTSFPGPSLPGTSIRGRRFQGRRIRAPCLRRCRIRSGDAGAPSPWCSVSLAVAAGIVVAAVFAARDNATNQPALLIPPPPGRRSRATWTRCPTVTSRPCPATHCAVSTTGCGIAEPTTHWQAVQRRVSQTVLQGRGHVGRQDRVRVAQPGAGAVHDAGDAGRGSRGAMEPSVRRWRSCSPTTTRSWCVPTCSARPGRY